LKFFSNIYKLSSDNFHTDLMGIAGMARHLHFDSSKLLDSPTSCETNGTLVEAEMTWAIKNFGFKSTTGKVGSMLKSATFYANQDKTVQWSLWVYPNGSTESFKGHVSLFVRVASSIYPTGPVNISLRLWDKSNMAQELVSRNLNKLFHPEDKTRGFGKMIGQPRVSEIENLVITCKLKYELNGDYLVTAFSNHNLHSHPSGSSLLEHNELIFKTMRNSDISFRIKDQEIQAHKFILISRSQVFAAMFEHHTAENQSGVVEIVDISPHTFRTVLYFMYTDQVKLQTEEEAKKLIVAADKYMLDLLKFKSEEFLISHLSWDNCLELLQLAYVYTAQNLKEVALQFVRQDIPQMLIKKKKEWEQLQLAASASASSTSWRNPG